MTNFSLVEAERRSRSRGPVESRLGREYSTGVFSKFPLFVINSWLLKVWVFFVIVILAFLGERIFVGRGKEL